MCGVWLRSKNSRSCGCLRSETTTQINRSKTKRRKVKKHRRGRHYLLFSPTYSSWKSMIRRCPRSGLLSLKTYNSVSIPTLCCKRWHRFEAFVQDMGKRPMGTALMRYLDSGSYEPGNVAWMSKMEQSAERSGKRAYLRLHKIHLKTKMSIRDAAQLALDIQQEEDLKVTAKSFHRVVMQALRLEARRLGKGMGWVEKHPIVTLFLNKLDSRSRRRSLLKASGEAKRLAEEESSNLT
jgi:hypothetical protein